MDVNMYSLSRLLFFFFFNLCTYFYTSYKPKETFLWCFEYNTQCFLGGNGWKHTGTQLLTWLARRTCTFRGNSQVTTKTTTIHWPFKMSLILDFNAKQHHKTRLKGNRPIKVFYKLYKDLICGSKSIWLPALPCLLYGNYRMHKTHRKH